MCDVVSAMMAGSIILGVVGKMVEAESAKDAAERNQREMEKAAALQFQAGAGDAWKASMKSSSDMASQVAVEAGTGFASGGDSYDRGLFASGFAASYRVDTIKANAAREARGMKVRADEFASAADDAYLGAILGSGGGVAKGAADIYGYRDVLGRRS